MAVLFTDAFTRTDENPLGNGDWTVWGAFNPLQLVSNAVIGTANGANNASLVTSGSFPNDQYAKATLGAIANHFTGVMVRCGAGGGYGFQRTSSGGQLFKWDPFGTYGALDSPSYTNNSGDVYEVRAIGTAITGWHNGVQVASATDSTHTAGRPGIYTFTGAGNDEALAFEAGDFSSGVAPAHYYTMMGQ